MKVKERKKKEKGGEVVNPCLSGAGDLKERRVCNQPLNREGKRKREEKRRKRRGTLAKGRRKKDTGKKKKVLTPASEEGGQPGYMVRAAGGHERADAVMDCLGKG